MIYELNCTGIGPTICNFILAYISDVASWLDLDRVDASVLKPPQDCATPRLGLASAMSLNASVSDPDASVLPH